MFDATSTTDDVLTGVDLRGKRILVTGVSSGLGAETARSLIAHGAWVVGAVRDIAKAEVAVGPIRAAAAVGRGGLEIVEIDLADLASVRACAAKLVAPGHSFDVLIANAGVMATPYLRTRDGFEMQFGVNHLGHFVLVNRLRPLLGPTSRLIVVSSAGHRFANVDLADPNFEHSPYEPFVAYGRSKTANTLFAVAFDQRHRRQGIRAASVHPGAVQTELNRHLDPHQVQTMIDRTNLQLRAMGGATFQWKTIAQGAATSVWAAVVADANAIGGRYCENCHVGSIVADDVTISANSEGVREYALDPASAEALWRKSEELVGESFHD